MSRRPPTAAGPWAVYLVRTRAGTLYTGIALDVAARLALHAAGKGAKALRGRGPLQLAFSAPVGRRGTALRLEARIKRLGKRDKERLVADAAFATALLRRLRRLRPVRRRGPARSPAPSNACAPGPG